MQKITLAQFIMHWARSDRQRAWHSLLSKNSEDFVTMAGSFAKESFISSFTSGGFYGSGAKWKPRESKWGKKFTHPVMNDQGELKSKIKGESSSRASYSSFGKRGYSRKVRYVIWTDEDTIPITGKRGRRNTKISNYAAVHNTDPKFGLYTVNQYSSRRPEHRQFIGHSSKILDKINREFVPNIFNGFPK